jgi:DNA-binding LytR/AlgR family response regulator
MTNTLSCIIVDDNYLDRIAVETELGNFDHLKLLGSFSNAMEALEMVRTCKPDVLFMDVNMPDITGLQLLRCIGGIASYTPICIIISSFPDYALEGFELNVFDYILKPVISERFNDAVKRLADFINIKERARAYSAMIEDEKIAFKEGHNAVYLSVNDIVYLEAFGDYTKVVTPAKNYLTLATLSNFLQSLPPGRFMRVHRSYVIAINKVKSLNVKNIDIGTSILPIGKTYLKEAKQTFK